MRTHNDPQFPQHPIWGESPHVLWGITAVDGDADFWSRAPIGSLYAYKNSATNAVRWFQKGKNDGADNDWHSLGLQCITETVLFSDFTDGGSTAGTYVLTEDIPQGAFVLRAFLLNVTGFTGDTSAVITVGDGTDVDRYNTGTPSVFTTANAIDLGAPSGVQIHAAAVTAPTLTVTSNADFTSVAAGALTIRIFFLV